MKLEKLSDGSGFWVCGYANAPNRLGGMTGWRPFIGSSKADGSAFVALASDDLTEGVFISTCAKDHTWLPGDFSAQLAPQGAAKGRGA